MGVVAMLHVNAWRYLCAHVVRSRSINDKMTMYKKELQSHLMQPKASSFEPESTQTWRVSNTTQLRFKRGSKSLG